MKKLMRYTYTQEGREVLAILEHVISTAGMEVFKCEHCEELFGGRYEELHEDKILCGICEREYNYEMKDAYGLENTDDEHQYLDHEISW